MTVSAWELAFTSPISLSRQSGVEYNKRISTIGGLSGLTSVAVIGSSPSGRIADTILMTPTGFSSRNSHASCVFDNRVFVSGGTSGVTGLADVLVSKDLKSWERLYTAPTSFSSHRMVAFGNPLVKLVIIGGYRLVGNTYLNDIRTSSDGRNWTVVTPIGTMWSARSGFGLLVYKGKLWLFGGHNGTVDFHDVWWTDDLIHWHEALSVTPWSARCHFGYAVWDERMWLIGGETYDPRGQGVTYSRETWYSRDGSTWKQAFDFPTALSRTYVGVVDNRMFVCQGVGNLNSVYQMNLG